MTQQRVRAVYMRGGTSRAVFFHERDLPPAGAARDRIISAALGSPDPYGRQLDGMGGGISSLSKACIIGPPTRAGADVDYTFAQVDVKSPLVDYAGNCGNCSSAVGPFAIDEQLVRAVDGETVVHIHNTNTRKLIIAHVPVDDGEAAVEGDFELPGVAGKGARIALDFVDPGGAVTGKLLPTGAPRDVIDGIEASCVDATNPLVFVRARDLGATGTESPAAIDGDRALSARLEKIRVAAAERMGIAPGPGQPKIAMVGPAQRFTSLDGSPYEADQVDLVARAISMSACHRAFMLTGAMCLAVAARIEGTLVHEACTRVNEACTRPHEAAGAPKGDVRLGHPSGVLPIDAAVTARDGGPWAERVTVYRTARRLMDGFVLVPR